MAADLISIEMFQDKKGSNGVTIYPRELSITWGDDKRYWKWFWILLESQDYKVVEIPRLIDVCWLNIKGKYEMSKLTPKVKYEVGFVVMMKEPVAGWTDSPVTFRIDLPDGESQSYDMNLSNVPRNEWNTLPIGEFKATGDAGDILFSVMQTKNGHWKKGLVIKNVVIRPVYN